MSEISKEALAAACAEKVKQLEFSVKQSAFDSARQELETELAIARVALLALLEREEPVAMSDDQIHDYLQDQINYWHAEAMKYREMTRIPDPQPAPIVPDEVIVLLNHLEDVLPDEAFNLIDVKTWNNVSMLSRPDVFRAAMLAAAPGKEG